MSKNNIICFAKDWTEDPTSNHHVMVEMAKTHRVLWLNSIGTRKPSFSSGRDLRKIFQKIRAFMAGPSQVRENLWVFTPIVLPFPSSKWARRINRLILIRTVTRVRQSLGMKEFQLWTFLPNVADYVGLLGETLVIYYVVDEWSMFSNINTKHTIAAERELLGKADVVLTSCRALSNDKILYNLNTHTVNHGVDHDLFSKALDPATKIPEDLLSLSGPIIGFFGTLQDWIDFDLIATIATARPEWNFVLIGQILTDVSSVEGLPNIHLLGRRPHVDLPMYCKGFDIGIIPYKINARMKYVNPIKMREYLSAGLAVISTPVPEVSNYQKFCHIAEDPETFSKKIADALNSDSMESKRQRSESIKSETWAAQAAKIRNILAQTEHV